MESRLTVDVSEILSIENGVMDGFMVVVTDEVAASGDFMLHELMKRHLQLRQRGRIVRELHVGGDGRARQSQGGHSPADECVSAACLVAFSRTPNQHTAIAKRQGCHLADLAAQRRAAIVDGAAILAAHLQRMACGGASAPLGMEALSLNHRPPAKHHPAGSSHAASSPLTQQQRTTAEAVPRADVSHQEPLQELQGAVAAALEALGSAASEPAGNHAADAAAAGPSSAGGVRGALHCGRRVLLVIDDVAAMEALAGGETRLVVEFLCGLQRLVCHGHAVSLAVLAHRDVPHPPLPPSTLDALDDTWHPPLLPFLLHHADVAVNVRALASGFSADVHGTVLLELRSAAARAAAAASGLLQSPLSAAGLVTSRAVGPLFFKQEEAGCAAWVTP